MTKIKKHRADQMTPLERKKAMERGESIDRIPCIPFMGEFKCRIRNRKINDFWHGARSMADIEIETFNRYGHDRLTVGPNTNGISEMLGAKVVYPENHFPHIEESGLKDYACLNNMEPIEFQKSRRLQEFVETVKILGDEASMIVPVEASVGGVFTIASRLRGTETLLRDLRKYPKEVHRFLRLITESQKNCIREIVAYGAGVAMADPVANPALIGPKMYEEFVFPYTKEITDYTYRISGKKVSLHMCGKTYAIWHCFRQLCVNEISLDNIIDLKRAAGELGNTVPIAGNVPPVDVILYGTKEEIFRSVKQCVQEGREASKGYTLATGCDIPFQTAFEKIDWMMDAARLYGKV